MYIEWETKNEIRPGFIWKDKFGLKHDGNLLTKLDKANKLNKLGVCRLKFEGKKDEQFYKIVNKSYKKKGDDVTCTLTYEPRWSLEDLQVRVIDQTRRMYFDFYKMWRDQKNAQEFFEGEKAHGQFIKDAWDTDMQYINGETDYDKLTEFQPMRGIAQDTVL